MEISLVYCVKRSTDMHSTAGRINIFFSASKSLHRLWGPRNQLPVKLSTGVKQPGCESEYSLPPIAEVKNIWNFTLSSSCVFMSQMRNGNGV